MDLVESKLRKLIAKESGVSMSLNQRITIGSTYYNIIEGHVIYRDSKIDKDHIYIKDDIGYYDWYRRDYFMDFSEIRDDKLNKLLEVNGF